MGAGQAFAPVHAKHSQLQFADGAQGVQLPCQPAAADFAAFQPACLSRLRQDAADEPKYLHKDSFSMPFTSFCAAASGV